MSELVRIASSREYNDARSMFEGACVRERLPMIEQENTPLPPQRPDSDDPQAWRVYWEENNQAWRTEPEIDEERQKLLTERRAIVPDITQGIYPFREMKLSRADVEWLLATHEHGRGPIERLYGHIPQTVSNLQVATKSGCCISSSIFW